MRKQTIQTVMLLSTVLSGAAVAGDDAEPNGVALTIVDSKVTAKTLEVRYRIANGSPRDIWICQSICIGTVDFWADYETHLPSDNGTLIIRRVLNVPGFSREFVVPPAATYLRLSAGQQRCESIVLPLPIRHVRVFFPWADQEDIQHTMRLRMEIGFYECDLPKEVFPKARRAFGYYAARWDRDRIFMVGYSLFPVKEDRMLCAEVDVPRIACAPEIYDASLRPEWPAPPDLSQCTRVRVEYRPSMLEYFFPDPEEQSLLSEAEKESLRSQKTVSVDRPEQMAALGKDVRLGQWTPIVAEETLANVLCYAGDQGAVSDG